MNHITNPLFDLFIIFKFAKIIWEKLEVNYRADDAGTSSWNENLCAEVLNENMKMCEELLANLLIEKFPPSWSYYRNKVKHKKKDLTL